MSTNDREFNATFEVMEAFTPQCGLGDAVYILLEHDLVTTEEVDGLSWRGDPDPSITFKPLLRRAYLDAVARGLVPGRLN